LLYSLRHVKEGSYKGIYAQYSRSLGAADFFVLPDRRAISIPKGWDTHQVPKFLFVCLSFKVYPGGSPLIITLLIPNSREGGSPTFSYQIVVSSRDPVGEAHEGSPGNERADALAGQAVEKEGATLYLPLLG
jgi:hypothetical protein